VKSAFRVTGIAFPRAALGKYGVSMVFHSSDKAIVIGYDRRYFVIFALGC